MTAFQASDDNPLKRAAAPRRNRWQVRSLAEAGGFLAKKARNAAKAAGNPRLLVLGSRQPLTRWICEDLEDRGMRPDRRSTEALDRGEALAAGGYAAVICTDTDIRCVHGAARAAVGRPELRDLPFEAVVLPGEDYRVLTDHSVHGARDLVSPLPLVEPDFAALYTESLERFEKKCDVRDYMDLCQAVHHVVEAGVPGDAAEFGSFRGHSGYLLARLLERRSFPGRLYLFDTFDVFPQEPVGVDRFWSGSHPVDFGQVRDRFRDIPFVSFVRGDFTETLESAGIDRLSLVHVDCDSYRATSRLAARIFPEVLSPGGVMVFEDYGHPQLFGSRVAVHDYFDGRADAFRFFSQFSGCYIVVKR